MSNHAPIKTISIICLALMLGLLSTPAMCCGSMGAGSLNFIITGIAVVGGAIILMVMLALVPVEVTIIRCIGLEEIGYSRTNWAYAYCLLAKFSGLAMVYTFMTNVSHTIFVVEGVYSLMHFIVALVGFIVFFGIEWRRAAMTALLISTVIPWPLSAAIRYLGTFVGVNY